jgi:two-component system, chemotaxis family, sensor kinase Cph1
MLQWLFEKDFMPHGHCYFWRPDILWTHVLSDGIIALAYFSIPVTLVYFLNKRRDFPFRGVLALFAAFIILCGTTHIFGIITVWKPIYAIDGLVKAATALVSIATALVIIPLVPIALGMRSPAELEAANQSLQEEIGRRRETESSLETAIDKLHRSNEELEQFASIASHDLQSPLRSIVNFTQLLKQNAEGKLDKDAEEFLGFIEQGGKRMQSLISDLLQVARINKGLPEMTVVSMNQVLESVREQLRLSLEETGATLEATDLPDVLGHEGQLVQLLQNLVGNATKYVAPGVKPVIRIRATREQNDWYFVVADNGIGIQPEHLKSIFVIFHRLHLDDQYPGSGIGLSICQKIIERHKGRIWVTSEPDKGSEFHFTLPAA